MFDFKDVGVRAFKTALQVFIAALPAGLIFTDVAAAEVAVKAAALAAAAAGVSVVMNAILTWTNS